MCLATPSSRSQRGVATPLGRAGCQVISLQDTLEFDGRAETEAVIAALTVALEEGKGADDRADLDARIERATAARETLGRRAQDLAAGTRGPALDLLTSALPSLLSALGALWHRRGDRDAATRATIAARLDAARWPPFADIAA